MVAGEALHIEGLGYIAQHHSYLDMYWSHGTPYFVRDCLSGAVENAVVAGKDPTPLIQRCRALDTAILKYEQNLVRVQGHHGDYS